MSVPASSQKPRLVKCPQCGAQSEYSESNPYRPFCSKRCKQIDLGDWADEKFRIPVFEDPRQQPVPGDIEE